MVAVISDFLLSLVEVDVAVVYSVRKDGWKFSVRSEVNEVDAGKLIAAALEGIGSGGGHAFMAGGIIRTDDLPKLGEYPEDRVRELFLNQLKGE